MKNRNWIKWTRSAWIRAVKTIAQTAVAMLPVAATITAVDWKAVCGTAALAGVASMLTSLAGLPEEDKASVAGEEMEGVEEGGGGRND